MLDKKQYLCGMALQALGRYPHVQEFYVKEFYNQHELFIIINPVLDDLPTGSKVVSRKWLQDRANELD